MFRSPFAVEEPGITPNASPLYGGGVIDLTQFDRILSLEGGVARVEPAARLDSQAPGHPV